MSAETIPGQCRLFSILMMLAAAEHPLCGGQVYMPAWRASAMKLKAKTKGALLILFSAFSFAWMSTFVFLAGEIPFFQKALFRNGVALLIAGSSMVVSKRTLSVPPPCRLALVSRVLCGSVSVFCNFYAIDRLLLASSNSLNKLAPFFAIVLAACFLGGADWEAAGGVHGGGVCGKFVLDCTLAGYTRASLPDCSDRGRNLRRCVCFSAGAAAGGNFGSVGHCVLFFADHNHHCAGAQRPFLDTYAGTTAAFFAACGHGLCDRTILR